MIRYSLKCSDGHQFESWFASSDAYETLRGKAMVVCATCGSADVDKALMAPRVNHVSKAEGAANAPSPAQTSADVSNSNPATQVSLSQPNTEVEKAIAALRAKVEASSSYVGKDFVRQARQMHQGERPNTAIHGEARLDEAKALIEEGVPVMPLPFTPKSRTN